MPRPQITRSKPYTLTAGPLAGQTFHSERQYRNALAKLKGFASEEDRRRTTPSSRSSGGSSEARARSLAALARMRREGLTLSEAASREGTTPATVLRHVGSQGLRQTRDGAWKATPLDRLDRAMEAMTTEGRQRVHPSTSREASAIGKHWDVISRVLRGEPGATRELRAFAGHVVGGFELESDADVIVIEGLRGEVTPESIYETTR